MNELEKVKYWDLDNNNEIMVEATHLNDSKIKNTVKIPYDELKKKIAEIRESRHLRVAAF